MDRLNRTEENMNVQDVFSFEHSLSVELSSKHTNLERSDPEKFKNSSLIYRKFARKKLEISVKRKFLPGHFFSERIIRISKCHRIYFTFKSSEIFFSTFKNLAQKIFRRNKLFSKKFFHCEIQSLSFTKAPFCDSKAISLLLVLQKGEQKFSCSLEIILGNYFFIQRTSCLEAIS